MILQPILNIAEICAKKGIKHAVLSPGSRSAPLTLAFVRNKKIKTWVIPDERSAAFIALGIAQETLTPVALICTSGTAGLNFSPAVAEAYFQQIPLIVFTADRPPEWIDQNDGQTIHQSHLFYGHVKDQFALPVDISHKDEEWHTYRMVSEALNQAVEFPEGPVHFNCPFREPFYPSPNEDLNYNPDVPIIDTLRPDQQITDREAARIIDECSKYSRILIISGQESSSEAIINPLQKIIENHNIPVIGDVISNLHSINKVIRYPDIILAQKDRELLESLKPQLLITFGKSVISKNLKLFLREFKPEVHWHVQPAGNAADTFQSLNRVIQVRPDQFFNMLAQKGSGSDFQSVKQSNFNKIWQIEEEKAGKKLRIFFAETEDGEFKAVERIIPQLPDCNLHLGNSLPVRLVNFIGLQNGDSKVFCNRGTSGIDGTNGTAVGSSLVSDKLTVLITGDMAFFYDRNAFWHNYDLKNLRVIILNNHAGGVFGVIDGPRNLPELGEYFETRQKLMARNTAEDHDLEYIHVQNMPELEKSLENFFKPGKKGKVLEIETDNQLNKGIFKKFKDLIIG